MGVMFMVKNRLLSCKIANDPFHVANIVLVYHIVSRTWSLKLRPHGSLIPSLVN